MRFVIENKVYDTNKMQFIGKVKKKFCVPSWVTTVWMGDGKTYSTKNCDLYRSAKGNWLLVYEDYVNCYTGCAIDEEEAKTLLMKSDYDTYAELFGELEEA